MTEFSEDQKKWKRELTDEEYRICREKGTERPFSGEYWDFWKSGTYFCKCCEATLFESSAKFDAGCGWPSFDREAEQGMIAEHEDLSLGMRRTEVTCANCGSHLGHVFPDGPTETGLRYCINSASISHLEK